MRLIVTSRLQPSGLVFCHVLHSGRPPRPRKSPLFNRLLLACCRTGPHCRAGRHAHATAQHDTQAWAPGLSCAGAVDTLDTPCRLWPRLPPRPHPLRYERSHVITITLLALSCSCPAAADMPRHLPHSRCTAEVPWLLVCLTIMSRAATVSVLSSSWSASVDLP